MEFPYNCTGTGTCTSTVRKPLGVLPVQNRPESLPTRSIIVHCCCYVGWRYVLQPHGAGTGTLEVPRPVRPTMMHGRFKMRRPRT